MEYGRKYNIPGEEEEQIAYYDIGIKPCAGDNVPVRAQIENKGKSVMQNASVSFEAEHDGKKVLIGNSPVIGEMLPGQTAYAYQIFVLNNLYDNQGNPIEDISGDWILRAYLVEGGVINEKIKNETRLSVNSAPVPIAADIADAMAGKTVYFNAVDRKSVV